MKHLRFLLVAIATLTFAGAFADELTAEQKQFRSAMQSFLREEGFAPYIDEDNSLCFKKEGELYWIDVADRSPFYVEFCRSGFGLTDADMASAYLACNKATSNVRCAKAYISNNSLRVRVEIYCHRVEDFKYAFYPYMRELDKAHDTVVEAYSEYKESDTPKEVSYVSAEIANVKNDNTIIDSYGSTIYDFKTQYLKPKVTLDIPADGTYTVFVKFYDRNGNLSTGSNSPTGYSFKSDIKAKKGRGSYELIGWGNSTPGNWDMGDYRMEFYIDGKRIGTKYFTVK